MAVRVAGVGKQVNRRTDFGPLRGVMRPTKSRSLSEEGRDQDQSITDPLPPEFEGFEHRQKEEFQGFHAPR
jgi:hypothetical protein